MGSLRAETQSLPSGHPSVKGSVAPSVGCPFANALNTRLVGEAYPRPLPPGNCPDGTLSGKTELGKHSYTCEQFRCPANSFATRLNPISFVHCECDVGYSADCESSPEGKCECMPTGPYTSYNPVGLRGFWGFEI